MDSNQIKGTIEFNGKKFSSVQVIEALRDQGFSIVYKNGILRVGQAFIDPCTDSDDEPITCPIIDNCKSYEKIVSLIENKTKNYPEANKDKNQNNISNSEKTSNANQLKNRVYENRIELRQDELNYHNIDDMLTETELSPEMDPLISYENIVEDEFKDSDLTEMVGISTQTRAGPLNNQKSTSKIPNTSRTKCPFCDSTVNNEWSFCGYCGKQIKQG